MTVLMTPESLTKLQQSTRRLIREAESHAVTADDLRRIFDSIPFEEQSTEADRAAAAGVAEEARDVGIAAARMLRDQLTLPQAAREATKELFR